jgi:hypothetical protein
MRQLPSYLRSRSTKRGQEPEYRACGRKSCPPSNAHKVHSVLNRYKVVNTISKAFPPRELRNAPFMYILSNYSRFAQISSGFKHGDTLSAWPRD